MPLASSPVGTVSQTFLLNLASEIVGSPEKYLPLFFVLFLFLTSLFLLLCVIGQSCLYPFKPNIISRSAVFDLGLHKMGAMLIWVNANIKMLHSAMEWSTLTLYDI